MILTFLGTAASEGYPNAFCGCENCAAARTAGGPSLRKRSSALLNDDLLIDLGPDLMAASQAHAVPLDRIRFCLQTHEHEDHLDPSHLLSRSAYCGVPATPTLDLYVSRVSLTKISQALSQHVPDGVFGDPEVESRLSLRVHTIAPGQSFHVGAYSVTSYAAAHVTEAMLFLIERDGRRLFYGTDTGPLPESTWLALAADPRPLHLLVLDHTFGMKDRSRGHMNADQFVEQVERMRAAGLVNAETRIYAHHLGHHSNPPHHELAAVATGRGYQVAHDGLRVAV